MAKTGKPGNPPNIISKPHISAAFFAPLPLVIFTLGGFA